MFAMTCDWGNETLEDMVRRAIALGELSPGLAAAIDRYLTGHLLNRKETHILAILQDAIANGVVKQIPGISPTSEDFKRTCDLPASQQDRPQEN